VAVMEEALAAARTFSPYCKFWASNVARSVIRPPLLPLRLVPIAHGAVTCAVCAAGTGYRRRWRLDHYFHRHWLPSTGSRTSSMRFWVAQLAGDGSDRSDNDDSSDAGPGISVARRCGNDDNPDAGHGLAARIVRAALGNACPPTSLVFPAGLF